MKKFLTDLLVFLLATGASVVVVTSLFYDFLPSHYSFFHKGPAQAIYADFFKKEGKGYNTVITGASDMKRNIIPGVLDKQDTNGEMKSFAMGMGGMTHAYLIDYLDYLLAHNPNINRIVIGTVSPESEQLIRSGTKQTIDEMSFWRNMTPAKASFYTKNLIETEKFYPLDLVKLLVRKYLGINMINIIKYRSTNNPERYPHRSYKSLTENDGDRGPLPAVINSGKTLLGIEEEGAVCGEQCKAFFQHKKELNKSKPPKDQEQYYKILAEKEVSQLVDFVQRAKAQGVEVAFVYSPRVNRDAFVDKEIVIELIERDCLVINFSDPEEYPEFYDLEYSLGKYQNRKGATFVSETIGKIISQNTHEYECH